ncbi:MAG TPA: phosphotransferase [Streptosporangiaceae bacterium]
MFDGFFDRVIAGALGRGVTQFVLVGSDSNQREQRHAKPGTRWWHVDDLTSIDPSAEPGPGLRASLASEGFEPDAPALFCCEGAVSGLNQAALTCLLAELRALATPGTRVAIVSPGWAHDGEEIAGSLAQTRWRAAEISARAHQFGLRVLIPIWSLPGDGVPASTGRIATFIERVLYRSASESIAAHLEANYDVTVTATRELDLGVHRISLAGGTGWIARVSPAVRDVDAVRRDAELLGWLTNVGFPAERPPAPKPVSVLDGQGMLVTEFARGPKLAADGRSFELLGRMLGKLHSTRPDNEPAALRPGGAWHHLLPDGTPAQEGAAIRALLDDARHRVPADSAYRYDTLVDAVEAWDSCADLPHAVVHADFVPRNAIRGPDDGVTIIDWAGAGWGPRIVSLGCLLWAAGPGANLVAAITGYRQSVTLESAEIDRLDAAMRLRPLVLSCWTFATGRGSLQNAADSWDQHSKRIDRAAAQARRLLTGPFPS